jgi:hypothetical protein
LAYGLLSRSLLHGAGQQVWWAAGQQVLLYLQQQQQQQQQQQPTQPLQQALGWAAGHSHLL